MVSSTEAAQVLKLHLGTLHRWRHSGKLRAWLRGRMWFFSRAELLAQFVAARPVQAKGPTARERRAEEAWVQRTLAKHGLA